MQIITVTDDFDPEATLICDCGTWKATASTDIEIMAKAMTHIRTHEYTEGVIEFPRKYIVITDYSITILEK